MPRLRDRLVEQMRQQSGSVPSGALGRLPRFGMLALRGGKLGLGEALRSEADKGQLNEETLSRLVTSVGELKGVTMKLGQMLSYVDVALPDDVRDGRSASATCTRCCAATSAALPIRSSARCRRSRWRARPSPRSTVQASTTARRWR
jgi:uncharacterized protein with von Willebrand factor type A (vWA) domain